MSLSGTASVQAEPDVAYISAAVISKDMDAQTALTNNSKLMNDVYNVLKAQGVERKEIATSNFSFNKTYRQVGVNSTDFKQVFDGYQVSNNVRVTVCDLENLGTIITTLVDAGVTNLGQVSFGSTEAEAKLNEARKIATKAAIEKAELYSKVGGFHLVRIISFHERQNYSQPRYSAMRSAGSSFEAPPISGGSLNFSITVSATWRIVDPRTGN